MSPKNDCTGKALVGNISVSSFPVMSMRASLSTDKKVSVEDVKRPSISLMPLMSTSESWILNSGEF